LAVYRRITPAGLRGATEEQVNAKAIVVFRWQTRTFSSRLQTAAKRLLGGRNFQRDAERQMVSLLKDCSRLLVTTNLKVCLTICAFREKTR
jgi:hypothetical protein